MTVLYLGAHDEQNISPPVSINALYPLRIIGLNQDKKVSGGMAGLTFMFTKSTTETYKFKEDSDKSYSIYGTTLGKFLASGGALCDSVKAVAVTVNKQQLETKNYTAGYDAKCFPLSVNELGYSPSNSAAKPGPLVGKNGDEMYLNFAAAGVSAGGGANSPRPLGLPDQHLRDLGTSSSSSDYRAYNIYGGSIGEGYLSVARPIAPCFCL